VFFASMLSGTLDNNDLGGRPMAITRPPSNPFPPLFVPLLACLQEIAQGVLCKKVFLCSNWKSSPGFFNGMYLNLPLFVGQV
jgi:hypothetical protein